MEAPLEMRSHLTGEFHTRVDVDREALDLFKEMTKGISIIRSAEIVALAYESNYFKKFREMETEAFESALYAVKFYGCAISFDEIREILREENAL